MAAATMYASSSLLNAGSMSIAGTAPAAKQGLTSSCSPCGSSAHYCSTSGVRIPVPQLKRCRSLSAASSHGLHHAAAVQPQASASAGQTETSNKEMEGDKRIKEIVVLGGGTAGWMTACYLAKAMQGTATVTLLESSQIPKLGVGEATVPHLQTVFFDFLGIPEDEWMRECNASYKMAVKFTNWCTPGEGTPEPRKLSSNRPDYFYHLFRQISYQDGLPLSHYWFHKFSKGETDLPYDYSCYHEPLAMDLNKSPRWMDGSYLSPPGCYAWHFDAHLVADYLRRHGTTKLGVRHIQDRMERVELNPTNGYIHALHTATGRELHADLFVDCSGFRGALINQALGEPFLDMNDHLLCNSAVATAVPHDDEANGIEPYTSAIGMKSGWTWKIPMLGRFGTGYVYSSEFCSPDEAAEDMCRMWGLNVDTQPLNKIRFRVGRNRRAWVGNCVSIGASSCFLEPLESFGIYFIYVALYKLVRNFPDKDFKPRLIDQFNADVETFFNSTRDFIQAHFSFSPRNDTPFWRACKELALGSGFQEKVQAYRAGLVVGQPFDVEYAYSNDFEGFRSNLNSNNYYSIFAGLGLLPDAPLPCLDHMPASVRSADITFERLQQRQKEYARTLPSCYDYLCKLHGRQLSEKANSPAM